MGQPKVLDELAGEFRRLGDPATRKAPGARRTLVFAVLLLLLLAGVATAAILISQGTPLPAAHTQDLRQGGVPLPGTAQLAGLDAPDPVSGAPSWDIRISRTETGETCSAVGQVYAGQFGIVGLDRVFRALPLGGVDSCGVDSRDGPVLAGARVFVGRTPAEARTVVNGIAGDGARSVTAYGPGGPRALRLGDHGSFITVYSGYVEEIRPRIVVVGADGRSRTIAFAASSQFETPDPAGGSPWQVDGGPRLEPGSYPDENCAQAGRELGLEDPSIAVAAQAPEVCGRLAAQPLFVSMRRFVPPDGAEAGFSGAVPPGNETYGFPWGENVARTLVYGAAAPRVAALTLTGDGAPRGLPIDRHGGLFIAVLDGHVDPRGLMLTARLRSGGNVSYRRSANLLNYFDNRPIPERPVPAYRSPLPLRVTLPPPLETPVAATVRETLRAPDPAGGPEWALRSWQGNPTAAFAGQSGARERSICLQVGLLRAGALGEPGLDRVGSVLSTADDYTARIGGCTQPLAVARAGHLLTVQSYVDEPFAYSPKPARTVVSGLLPPGAGNAVLLGAGAPRRLRLDANNAFLAVLPGRYWGAPLRVADRLRGRAVGYGPPPRPGAPTAAQARAPDPGGGAPWGIAVSGECATATSRIIDGRLAYIDELSGAVTNGASMTSSGRAGWCFKGLGTAPRQLFVEVSTVGSGEAFAGQPAPPLSRPQIERRVLQGRTVIAGSARADVSSITLATPRDVRTLVPAGPHRAFISVYDGRFFRGELLATAHLRDGRDVVEALPLLPGGGTAPREDLQTRVRLLALQEREARSFTPRPARDRARPALGRPQIAAARRARLAPLEAAMRALQARMAFERAHPGVLPAQ